MQALKTVGNIASPKATAAWAWDVRPPEGSISVESLISTSIDMGISIGVVPVQPAVIKATSLVKGSKIHNTITEPNTLNKTWPIAVRFAARLPLKEANIGVMVVPIFPPNIIAHPKRNDIHPWEHIIRVMANVAAEL